MGVEWEGEDQPTATAADHIALEAFKYLVTYGGSIDWSGLPVVAELLGVDDIEDLIERLMIIKLHRRPTESKE